MSTGFEVDTEVLRRHATRVQAVADDADRRVDDTLRAILRALP